MRVLISPHIHGRLKVAPDEYLGKATFKTYREACQIAGAKYNVDIMAQEVAAENLGELIHQLQTNKFDVTIDPSLREVGERQAEEVAKNIEMAASRAMGLKLRPYQIRGAKWLASRSRGLLGDEPGLGKTIEAISAIGDLTPVVVICPQIAKRNWELEVTKWQRRLEPVVLSGTGSFRWPGLGVVVITNYNILPKVPPRGRLPVELGHPLEGTHVIVDEAHYCKSGKTARSRATRAISKAVKALGGRVWLMTGTPLANKPPELWAILSAAELAEDAFGSWPNFVRLMGGVTVNMGFRSVTLWPDGDKNKGRVDPRVPKLLERVMLRRTRVQVADDLPPRAYKDIVVPLSAGTRRLADTAWAALRASHSEAALVDQAEHPMVAPLLASVLAKMAEDKVKHALELVEDYELQEEPLVLVSAHRAPIEAVAKRPGWRAILGGDNPKEREQAWQGFQAGSYGPGEPARGLAMTIAAGGVSITVTRAAHMLMVDESWNPAENEQVIARIQRHTQTRSVLVTRLYADHPIDRLKARVLARKAQMIAQAGL